MYSRFNTRPVRSAATCGTVYQHSAEKGLAEHGHDYLVTKQCSEMAIKPVDCLPEMAEVETYALFYEGPRNADLITGTYPSNDFLEATRTQPYSMWYEPEGGSYFQRGMSLKQTI
jgi:hypothetical protein